MAVRRWARADLGRARCVERPDGLRGLRSRWSRWGIVRLARMETATAGSRDGWRRMVIPLYFLCLH